MSEVARLQCRKQCALRALTYFHLLLGVTQGEDRHLSMSPALSHTHTHTHTHTLSAHKRQNSTASRLLRGARQPCMSQCDEHDVMLTPCALDCNQPCREYLGLNKPSEGSSSPRSRNEVSHKSRFRCSRMSSACLAKAR